MLGMENSCKNFFVNRSSTPSLPFVNADSRDVYGIYNGSSLSFESINVFDLNGFADLANQLQF